MSTTRKHLYVTNPEEHFSGAVSLHEIKTALNEGKGLDFVIARPTRLTNGKAKGKYMRTAELISVPGSIARADVAEFLVEACESTTWVGKGVQLGG